MKQKSSLIVKIVLSSLMILSVGSLLSCDELSVLINNIEEIAENAQVLDESDQQAITEFAGDGNRITFDLSKFDKDRLRVGSIIISGKADNIPDGLLRKVVSITISNGKLVVETEPITLEEAVRQGSADIGKTLTPDDIETFTGQAKQSKETDTFSLDLEDIPLYDADGDLETTDDQIVVNGTISVKPSFNLKVDIERYRLSYLEFVNDANISWQLNATVGSAVDIDEINKSFDVLAFVSKPIVTQIESIPFIVRPVISLVLGGKGTVAPGLQTVDVAVDADYKAGCIYNQGQWKTISDFSTDFNSGDPSDIPKNGKLQLYAGYKMRLLIYGLPGPQATLAGFQELAVDDSQIPWWKLYGGLWADVGVNFAPLSSHIPNFSERINSLRKLLAEAKTQTADPNIVPPSQTFTDTLNVAIACLTPNAKIYYTVDGSTPDESSSLYTSPIPISQTTTVTARAFRNGMYPSGAVSETYTKPEKVDDPVFEPVTGTTFIDTLSVSISCPTAGATIYYTTDGSIPNQNSNEYSEPVVISQSTVFRALAVKAGMAPSDIVPSTYTKLEKVAAPQFNPDGGTFIESTDVEILCPTGGASIYYTTDGSDPDENSSLYSGVIAINQTTTFKARAYKSGMAPSDIVPSTYTKLEKVAAPVFEPVTGAAFIDTLSVSISCPTTGATIYYTTDGSVPDQNSNQYSEPVVISQSTVFRARAVKSGMAPSDIVPATYTKLEKVAAPQFDPDGGSFTNSVQVEISCDTAGASIYYTTDGSEPTVGQYTSSTAGRDDTTHLYTAPLNITETTTINAKAVKAGMTPSDNVEKQFIIEQDLCHITEVEPNDDQAYATPFDLCTASPTYLEGTLTYSQDMTDWFMFTLSEGDDVTINVVQPAGIESLVVQLFDSSNHLLGTIDLAEQTGPSLRNIVVFDGTYYIRVITTASSLDYQLKITVTPSETAAQGYGNNNEPTDDTRAQATQLTLDQYDYTYSISMLSAFQDINDWYQISLEGYGFEIFLQLYSGPGEGLWHTNLGAYPVTLELYDSTGYLLDTAQIFHGDDPLSGTVWIESAEDVYYIRVYSQNWVGFYELTIDEVGI